MSIRVLDVESSQKVENFVYDTQTCRDMQNFHLLNISPFLQFVVTVL